jgi:hypothetical protein
MLAAGNRSHLSVYGHAQSVMGEAARVASRDDARVGFEMSAIVAPRQLQNNAVESPPLSMPTHDMLAASFQGHCAEVSFGAAPPEFLGPHSDTQAIIHAICDRVLGQQQQQGVGLVDAQSDALEDRHPAQKQDDTRAQAAHTYQWQAAQCQHRGGKARRLMADGIAGSSHPCARGPVSDLLADTCSDSLKQSSTGPQRTVAAAPDPDDGYSSLNEEDEEADDGEEEEEEGFEWDVGDEDWAGENDEQDDEWGGRGLHQHQDVAARELAGSRELGPCNSGGGHAIQRRQLQSAVRQVSLLTKGRLSEPHRGNTHCVFH